MFGLLKCRSCHHEWEVVDTGEKNDRCDWCRAPGAHIVLRKPSREDSLMRVLTFREKENYTPPLDERDNHPATLREVDKFHEALAAIRDKGEAKQKGDENGL